MAEQKTMVLILFGGVSSEYEVSCKSAASIIRNLDTTRFDMVTVGITKDEGRWFRTTASADEVETGAWVSHASNTPCVVSPDRSVHGIIDENGETTYIDVAFPVLHGKNGEDGTMQGLFEIAGLPYVGPGVLGSAIAMDKGVAKIVADHAGINQATYCETNRYDFSQAPTEELARIEETIGGYPMFVKPANAGSSVGISKVSDAKELFEGIKLAAEHDHKIVIEEAIVGREMEVAVLGNRDPKASPVGEIQAADEFYSYDAKYNNDKSIAEVAENLPEEVSDKIRATAVEVYKALNLRGMSRVDFFLRGEDEVIFNEANTIPGFTNISMYAKLWGAAGVSYTELVTRLLDLAMEEI